MENTGHPAYMRRMAFSDLTYETLPQILHRKIMLEPLGMARLVMGNDAVAQNLGLAPDWPSQFDFAKPQQALAMAYAGHQFGGFSPSLGDGRAALLAEVVDGSGQRFDLHAKGSGPTPYSRNGDGRATLSAMLREYIVSEAMAGLGIPTTRALAVFATGEAVYRERAEKGAVLIRVAKSHVRVGTFQYLAARQDMEALRALADHEIARNFSPVPEGANPYHWLLEQAIARQSKLVAKWMSVGFIHGVMNTDNMQPAGETIDYGPCAFIDRFHPQKVFSSIDQNGRYGFDKQPVMALWNLTRFAEALLPLLHETRESAIAVAEKLLLDFMPQFEAHFETLMLAKLGIFERRDDDADLIAATLQVMADTDADFTLFFRQLTDFAAGQQDQMGDDVENWRQQWAARRNDQPHFLAQSAALMALHNPVVIARNHRVAEALRAAENDDDFEPTHRLVAALKNPFMNDHAFADLQKPPLPEEEVTRTFCGT